MISKFVTSLFFLLCFTLAAPSAFADPIQYSIDSAHSTVLFRVKHKKIAYVYGRFLKSEATITYDEANVGASSIVWTAQADSVFTNVKKRDDHLRSPDFLDAKQFPTIEFKSSKVESIGGTTMRVTGNLSLHGVTREITFLAEMTGTAKGRDGEPLIGFFASFDVNRSDYGVKGVGATDDRVHLIVTFEGIGPKP